MLQVTAMDVDAARDAILPGHMVLVRDVGRMHKVAMSNYETLISSETYIGENYRRLWEERGVLHCMAAGVVVSGSVMETVLKPITVPHIQALSPTDDPNFASDLTRDWGVLTLVESLVMRGGESLRGSSYSRVDEAQGNLALSQETRNLCGATIMFTLLSMGQVVTIIRSSAGLAIQPPKDEFLGTAPVLMPDVPPQEYVTSTAPDVSGEDAMEELLNKYVPTESVVSRRPKLGTGVVKEARVEPVVVSDYGSDHVRWLQTVSQDRWGVIETSGQGLMCGARALQISINAIAECTGQGTVELAQVIDALETGLDPHAQEAMRVGGVIPSDDNFTVDQMAGGVRQLGNYILRVIEDRGVGEVVTYDTTAGANDSIVVPVYYKGNHWSGIGPGSSRPLQLAKHGRAPRRVVP
jgi:hypothetical protein